MKFFSLKKVKHEETIIYYQTFFFKINEDNEIITITLN